MLFRLLAVEVFAVSAFIAAGPVGRTHTAPHTGGPMKGATTTPLAATTTTSLREAIGESNVALFGAEEVAVLEALLAQGQRKLFEDWPAAGVDDEKKRKLALSLVKLDRSYVGGLETYARKARALLESSAKGENAFEGLEASVPEGESLEYGSADFDDAEVLGLEAAKVDGVGFVLVAGGLGERLGYDGIKLELPVEGATGTSFLGLYVDYVRALSKRVGRKLPLCIMTSDDTDAKTRQLLQGVVDDDVDITFIKQEKVAALSDSSASIAVENKWDVVTKPHGHGDVHALLKSSGIAAQWLEKKNLKYAFFFQDTNALVLHSVLPALGVSKKRGFSMNSVCVPRRAGEAAGAIAKLTSGASASGAGAAAKEEEKAETAEGLAPLVINVEYNQLGPLLAEKGGDVNEPTTGYSAYPGNANVLVLDLADYVRTLEGEDEGVVDEFVNPKYKDDTKTTFKKPTRLECMMQDYPKLLRREVPTAAVGFTQFERWVAFSPAKNDLAAARTLATEDEPPSSASSTEFDVYRAHALRSGIRSLSDDKEETRTLGGVANLYRGPTIVFTPAFALTRADLRQKARNLSLDDDATLVVDGANVKIESLTLKNKAALVVVNRRDDATLTVADLVLDEPEGGLVFQDVPDAQLPNAAPSDRIRGYTTSYASNGVTNITIDKPGHFLLTNAGDLIEQQQQSDDDDAFTSEL